MDLLNDILKTQKLAREDKIKSFQTMFSEEPVAVKQANIKAQQVQELEDLKLKQEKELEALKDRHERTNERLGLEKEKESENIAIQKQRDADRKANESVELEESKVTCPKCEGKGCDHCGDTGYHIKEGKLVTSAEDIIKMITKKVADRLEKEYSRNPEKGLGMINTIGAMIGYKVTDQKQEKGKLFLKFGEELEEGRMQDAIKKVKGLTKKQLDALQSIPQAQLTVLAQQLSSLVMGEEEVEEGYYSDKNKRQQDTLKKHDKRMIKISRDSIKKYEKDRKESVDEARAKQAVSQGKVQKLVTAHGLKFKGKVYKEIDMELKGIDNNTKMVTFNIIHPKEIFGNEVKLAFKVLSRGPFMATDTSKINEDFQLDEKIEGLVTKAEKSGMPYSILKKVYDRGMVAWKTGHRPGTTPQQWAFARVNSFVTKSSGTWGKADKDLAQQVRGEETVEDPREVGTDARRKATQEMTPGQKVFSFTEHVNCGTPDCCNQCNTSSLIESNQYRVGSEMYFEFFNDKRKLMSEGKLSPVGFDKDLLEGDIGKFAMFEGQNVPLDCPMIEEEKDVELNKPKVGGPKKYYVYVKDGDKVKKVTWGDTTGLKVKLNDLGARKSFAARHRCDQQKDRTTAAYWACNLPRYADQLGLSGGGNFFW